MIVDERYEALNEIGSFIQEVHFLKIPEYKDLFALVELNKDLRVYMPLDKQIYFDEYSYCAENIYEAHFVTDSFIDSELVAQYDNLRNLVLYCQNDTEYFHSETINSMQLAIAALSNLKSLKFCLQTTSKTLIDQLSNCFIFPYSNFKFDFLVGSNKGRFKSINT